MLPRVRVPHLFAPFPSPVTYGTVYFCMSDGLFVQTEAVAKRILVLLSC